MAARCQGSLPCSLDAEKREGQECQRIGSRVLEPGQGAAEPKRHASGRGRGTTEIQMPEEEVTGATRHEFEQDMKDDEAETVLEEQDGRKERCRLHPSGKRGTQTFVRVPPRNVSMEPVSGG